MYKALIFDLGKVLVNFDFKRAYQTLSKLCPLEPSEIPKRLATTGLPERLETGLIEPAEFVEQICATLNLRKDYDFEGFCRDFSCIFAEELVPESMIQALAARYRLVLLSNTNAIHFPLLCENYPLLRHFQHRVLSYEVKAMKPSPKIYQAALERAGCIPGECFYTDDIAEYVEAARRMGIDAVQFVSVEQLREDLGRRGISW
jgi:putative hydrolase of the HAD superfamily